MAGGCGVEGFWRVVFAVDCVEGGFWRVFSVDCVWEGFAEGCVGEDSCEGFWGGFFVRGFFVRGFSLKGFFLRDSSEDSPSGFSWDFS